MDFSKFNRLSEKVTFLSLNLTIQGVRFHLQLSKQLVSSWLNCVNFAKGALPAGWVTWFGQAAERRRWEQQRRLTVRLERLKRNSKFTGSLIRLILAGQRKSISSQIATQRANLQWPLNTLHSNCTPSWSLNFFTCNYLSPRPLYNIANILSC